MAEADLRYRFGDFLLDASNRQLLHAGNRVDLNARYFDALVLLVREHGQLVEKDRFFAEVWQDVVVSDSALTQCIKDIRRQLGDDASRPRFIETVPRFGYRFIAQVEVAHPESAARPMAAEPSSGGEASIAEAPGSHSEIRDTKGLNGSAPAGERMSVQTVALWGGAGALGGGFAGVLGGLLYGSALAYSAAGAGLGTASILVVLLSVNILVGLIGGAGVSLGMAAMAWMTRRSMQWSISGAALGGFIVGSGSKLLGVDAFNLLFGSAPAGITGGMEGAALGAALALGARLGGRLTLAPRWRPVVGAGIAGAVVGALIPVAGGHLMGGSLALLARSFDGSRLQLDALGRFFGEGHFGHTTQLILSSVEGLLFATCVVGALTIVRRILAPGGPVEPDRR